MAVETDRRRYPRYEPPDLRCTLDGVGPCPVLTINLGGLLTLSEREFELGRELELTLHLDPQVRAQGEVAFVGPNLGDTRDRFRTRIGIGFEAMDPANREMLADYIESELA